MDKENRKAWESHYLRSRSVLSIPDENVVRWFSRFRRENLLLPDFMVLDAGSGSGRHLDYIRSLGFSCIGLDYAYTALSEKQGVVQGQVFAMPFKDNAFNIVLMWGVLHYLTREQAKTAMEEVYRILKPGGKFFFTLRSDQDTHLSQVQYGGDLTGGKSHLYSRQELVGLLGQFKNFQYGFLSRQPLGQEALIAHHMAEVTK